MAMNKFMHPRNPYKTQVDFKQLALDYPEFRKFARPDLSGKVLLNFKAEGTVWTLTKCLLHKDFGLNVETLPSHLVPTVPLRMNYILWIEDLMELYQHPDEQIKGIDIGTGACCIYPLLAAKKNKWKMLSTEVELANYDCAVANIERNGLQDLIQVKKVESSTFLCGAVEEGVQYDFCMCNPPFFNEQEEGRVKNRTGERTEPKNAHSGITVELASKGGEVAFVNSIFKDSQNLRDKVKIYTTMLGHKSSMLELTNFLKKSGVKVSSTSFCQGRTTRWGLAWTYDNSIDLDKARIPVENKKKEEYIRTQNFDIKEESECFEISKKILELLRDLEVKFE